MIGLLRPLPSLLHKEQKRVLRAAHCTGCIAVRRHASWPSAVSYPYEADVLTWLLLGYREGDARERWTPCTGLPAVPRRILHLERKEQSAVGAFAVLVSWATADDHRRDEGSLRARTLLRILDPHLENALKTLEIHPGAPPDPRLLAGLDESSCATSEGLLALYSPFVAGLWRQAFLSAGGPALRGPRGERLAELLARVLLLADAWTDRVSDPEEGRPNPASGSSEDAREIEVVVHASLEELSLLTLDAREPFRSLLRNVFTAGVPARLASRSATALQPVE